MIVVGRAECPTIPTREEKIKMSEVNGNNPATGESHPDVTAEQQAKEAKRAAAKVVSEAKALDSKFCKKIVSIESGLADLGGLIDDVIATSTWEHVTDKDGKPFTSWQSYVTTRVQENTTDPTTGESLLSKAMSKAYVVLLRDRGVSVRAAAKAASVSVGTAAQAGKDTREARPGGDSATVASTASATAAKVVTQVMNANKRVLDTLADMSDAELQKLRIDLHETHNKVVGMINLRGQIAAKRAETPSVPKPGSEPQKVTAAA